MQIHSAPKVVTKFSEQTITRRKHVTQRANILNVILLNVVPAKPRVGEKAPPDDRLRASREP